VNYRRDHASAEAVVRAIETEGGRAIAVAADISVGAEVVRLFETTDERLGRPVGLVNNAGILETCR
jgi:NAD(P)-dependent dehydrogenase (short-subunit alcohol dehydrogenase family)